MGRLLTAVNTKVAQGHTSLKGSGQNLPRAQGGKSGWNRFGLSSLLELKRPCWLYKTLTVVGDTLP